MGNCLGKNFQSQPGQPHDVTLSRKRFKHGNQTTNRSVSFPSNTEDLLCVFTKISYAKIKEGIFHGCKANVGNVKHDEKYGVHDFVKVSLVNNKLHVYKLTSFTYNTLKATTQKFSKKNLLGEGGSGDVFKGWIDLSTMTAAKPKGGYPVAVKRLKKERLQGREEWMTELSFLKRLNHPNVVKIIGYCCNCSEDDHSILVLEYMSKGSLEAFLLEGRDDDLNWRTRLKIAVGSAKGLEYLHGTSSPVIHRDMKSSNILLDNDYTPKISDFGLAKFGPQDDKSHTSSRILGTKGYFAPEYIGTGHLTMKTDVYSFGVVLLEILSGRVAVTGSYSGGLEDLVEWGKPFLNSKPQLHCIIDKKMGKTITRKDANKFAKIICQCLDRKPKRRPTMKEVVRLLEELEQGMNQNGQKPVHCLLRK
ncbi:serine/threonine-protein kinase BIK1-like [Apium graveolens]|uniref:serine/threonine-protein kinase BIK1-like n=1 Tax=Apium graveolens TaxID=4045 RepID=UPI003D7A63F6